MTRFCSCFALVLTALISLLLPLAGQCADGEGAPLAITRTGRVASNRFVVRVPREFNQLVIEQRDGAGWKPLRVQHLTFARNQASTVVPVTVPGNVKLEDLRALAYSSAKFPTRFTKGRRVYARPDVEGGSGYGGPVAFDSRNLMMAATTSTSNAEAVETPAAEESDIWKISGSRLLFFNQYRGLQVFDMSNPATPVRTGTLRMAASGEQMYILNSAATEVALLGRSNHRATAGQAALFLVRITGGMPQLVAEVPLTGYVSDSRLIGSRLYVLSSVWSQVSSGTGLVSWNWKSESVLQAVDLADLAAPATLPALTFQGGQGNLQAVGANLLVSSGDYSWNGNAQFLHLIGIGGVNGAPELIKSFPTRGSIQDKFKMSLVNGSVAAVTSLWNATDRRRETWVETFPMDGPGTKPLAQLELLGARAETLHATRFDGNRVYVVTFRNIDPLFVVDLANPEQPVLGGVLEIPGWSTYIEPLGDRLLAVGVESGRVTVSLFNVADFNAPELVSRIPLGPAGTWSWSEANYDEKAVQFSKAEGIVMVPFQNWTAQGHQMAMQAIHVGQNELTLGQTIQHASQARRGTVMGNHLVSISGKELIVLARNNTTEVPDLQMPLSWTVDRVVPAGDYLLQVDDGPAYWSHYPMMRFAGGYNQGGQAKAVIRVSTAADPDELIEEVEIGAGRVVGMVQKGSLLYLAQWVNLEDGASSLRTWVLDITQPAHIQVVATLDQAIAPSTSVDTGKVQGLWLREDLLVWFLPGQVGWWNWWQPIEIGLPVLLADAGATGAVSSAVSFAAPAVAKSEALLNMAALLCPIAISPSGHGALNPVRVDSTSQIRGTSAAVAESGFLFFSHDSPRGQTSTSATSSYRPIPSNYRSWLESHLRVVDFRFASPVIRNPTAIAGPLLAVSQADAQGAVLLTNAESAKGYQERVVQAAAYDGVSAWQLDQVTLNAPYYTPTTSDGARLFFAKDGETPAVLSVGYDSATGRILPAGSWSTTNAPAELSVVENLLLASGYGSLELAEITPGALVPHGFVYDTPANLWLRVARTALSPAGLWIPAGEYGVEFLPWANSAP